MGRPKKSSKHHKKKVTQTEELVDPPVEELVDQPLEEQVDQPLEEQVDQPQEEQVGGDRTEPLNDGEHLTDEIEEEEQNDDQSNNLEDENEVIRDGINSDSEFSEPAAFDERNDPLQPKSKRQRGPTKMKSIAKDPNAREPVDFTPMGELYGPGSVKLSSYLGPLIREHVPVIIDDWRKIGEDTKTVLWKSVQNCYFNGS
ncbi:uncharacterized protein LOC111830038 [Capsella rubella]|uniref:uncharacterized protein LOC111830038 n=1 Tax=Capsella rubella TaxID=81985 RepID=UPI000CD4F691|nr:uncharacterized protein LOC111830038 [Capsella rubella]